MSNWYQEDIQKQLSECKTERVAAQARIERLETALREIDNEMPDKLSLPLTKRIRGIARAALQETTK